MTHLNNAGIGTPLGHYNAPLSGLERQSLPLDGHTSHDVGAVIIEIVVVDIFETIAVVIIIILGCE